MHDLRGAVVMSAGSRQLGRVDDVLVRRDEPVVCGLAVRPTPLLGFFERRERYVPFSDVTVAAAGHVEYAGNRLPRPGAAAAAAGIDDWERTVAWRGMPVGTPTGANLGVVRDFELREDGRILGLTISGGVVADAAVGSVAVEPHELIGFADGAVRVAESVVGRRGTGGLASTAGRVAAQASVVGEKAAKRAEKHVHQAARGTGKGLRKLRDFVKEGWQDGGEPK